MNDIVMIRAFQETKKFCQQAALTVLALALICGSPCAWAGLVPVSPEAKTFKLGALEISVLRDSRLVVSNDGSIFGLNANPAAVTKVLSDAGAPTNEIQLDVDTLLIRMPDHLVMIDTGFGPTAHGVVQKSLALVGVSPADITDILITHSHLDHVGGLVDAIGQSAFPKATILMSAREWAYMKTTTNAAVPVIKAQVKAFVVGHPILPGIMPVSLFGHTPGHSGYEITSEGHQMVAIGDMTHSAVISLAKPNWTLSWDSNKPQGAAIRRKELQHIVDTHELVFAPHFPFPGVGWIEPSGEGFKFVPDIPQDK